MSQSLSMEERVSEEVDPESFRSMMIITNLEKLQSFCFISDEFGLILTSSDDRIHVPPVDCVGVYEEAVKANLRFSLHSFVKRVMERFSLSLAQVALNSWRYIVGFVSLCRMLDRRPTIGLFRACFILKRHPSGGG